MKKVLNLILIVFVVLTLTSCVKDDRVWYYHRGDHVVVDENESYNNKYYIEFDFKNYYIFNKEKKELIDQINDNEYIIQILSIYDDTMYLLVKKNNDFYYTFKKIGDKETLLEDNMKSIDKDTFDGFLEMNGTLFYSNLFSSLVKIDYNIDQAPPYNGNVHSIYNSVKNPKSFILNIIDEEKVVLESKDKSERYTFDISLEVKNAEYKKHTNYFYYDVFNFIEPDDIPKYDLYKPIVILEDDNLYFSYGKYLGEFGNAKHHCTSYLNCLFSNRQSEILRFNNSTKQIESVAILPEGFTPLKIYLDKAIVMKNNIIAEYNYQTKELSNQIEVDWTNYYAVDNWGVIKLIFEDNKFIGVDVNYNNYVMFYNYDVKIKEEK